MVLCHATVGALMRQYWFHFLPLIAIIVFMVIGFSGTTAVFWATAVAIVSSYLHVDCALVPYDVLRGRVPLGRCLWNSGLTKALEAGSAAATPALLHDVKLLFTAIFTSLIVWIVGLGAGDGELHHLRGDRGTRTDRGRRRELMSVFDPAGLGLLLMGSFKMLADAP